jgi:hypothetical protein
MGGHDRLTPEGRRFFAQIEQLKKLQVQVGFQAGAAADEDGVDIANIAMWNELGTSRSPARPFMRKSVDENTDKIKAMCTRQLKRLAQGADAQDILEKIGVFQKGLIQRKIVDGTFEPNAASTIRRKGSSRPLIDTGRMRQSVNYIIRRKGEG